MMGKQPRLGAFGFGWARGLGVGALAAVAFAPLPAAGQAPPAGAAAPASPKMIVQRPGETPSKGAPTEFTGDMWREGSFTSIAPGRIAGGTNTFAPGARTFWHSHPLGQVMVVVSGLGLTQVEGEPPVLMRPGEVFTVAPGVRHWHGATAKTPMAHVAVVERGPGGSVVWQEALSDEAYAAAERVARAAR